MPGVELWRGPQGPAGAGDGGPGLGGWAAGPRDQGAPALSLKDERPWAVGAWALDLDIRRALGPWALGQWPLYMEVLWALFILIYPLWVCPGHFYVDALLL